ncbi:segregation and condensation protein A [uncultured Thiothrix sp.]|uniref:segregation and condensation protein A n=1 Tax=uncultured Thiothrix sp. TaxID=223185 RepID=UPI0026233BFB|nr:segregation and condensation protein A [uncultured Thiothrix sp.]
MVEQTLSQERRILMALRKTLASIVRDLTPKDPHQPYPLSTATVEDMKACFDLIAARERELAAQAGLNTKELPRFTDEPRAAQVISVTQLNKKQ